MLEIYFLIDISQWKKQTPLSPTGKYEGYQGNLLIFCTDSKCTYLG